MMVRTLFVILLAGCASQVVFMSRGSSGAVELDSDFQPSGGADHHYISFPQYPFANCNDPLMYDRLVDQIYVALTNTYKPVSKPGKTERELEAIKLFTRIRDTRIGRLAAESGSAELTRYLVNLARAGAARAGRFVVPDTMKRQVKRSAFAALAEPSLSSGDSKALEATAANDAGELIDRVLHGAHSAAFTVADLAPFGNDTELGSAVAEIEGLAESYNSTPCSSSMSYRDFLGYTTAAARDVSWIDRTGEQQAAALKALADEFGLAISGWPRSDLSFLQFSDVQIREPGAKLGGPQLSNQLRSIEASFEQDYVQELYALYGYDAIVKTATREIQLLHDMQLDGAMASEVDQRPAPTLMIHTGDSADTVCSRSSIRS